MADGQPTWMMSSTATAAASSASAQHLLNSPATLTTNQSLLSLSPRALLKLPLRAVHQIEAFKFVTLPRNLARLVGLDNVLSNDWLGNLRIGREADALAAAAASSTAANAAEGAAEAGLAEGSLNFTDMFQAMRRFSGFFSYMTSRWSLTCFSVVGFTSILQEFM